MLIADRRFLGCGAIKQGNGVTIKAMDSVRPYHYGRYNWNEMSTGDKADVPLLVKQVATGICPLWNAVVG